MNHQTNHAQGTIEYLVIIAVVVVISLIVVSMIGGMTGSSGDITKTTSKISSSTQAIAVIDTLAATTGQGAFTLRNNTGETITVNSISVDGTPKPINTQMALSDQKTFSVTGLIPCSTNQKSYNISITYTSSYGITKTEDLGEQIISCEDTIAVAGATQVCGNNLFEGTEKCDGTDLNSQTCITKGFTSGTITCLTNCIDFNTTQCVNDSSPPSIALLSPISNGNANNGIVDFNFIVNDASNVSSCTLFVDGSSKGVLPSPQKSPTVSSFPLKDITPISIAAHAWDINCVDQYGNSGLSGSPRTLNYTAIYLQQTDGNVANDSNLVSGINPSKNSSLTYNYNWYKDNLLYATTLLNDSRLRFYWPMDNDALDYVQTSDGTISGGAIVDANGKVGKAYNFPSTGSYMAIPSGCVYGNPCTTELNRLIGHGYGYEPGGWGPGVANTTGYTIALWIKLNAPITPADTATRVVFWGGNGIHLQFNNASVPAVAYGGRLVLEQHNFNYPDGSASTTANCISDATTWDANRWYHIAVDWNLTTLKLYVNGVLQSSQPAMSLPPRDWWMVGNMGVGGVIDGTLPLNGSVDELMVFDQALNQADINKLYYGGLYGGDKMGPSQTSVGEQWKVGYKTSSGTTWSSDTNSNSVLITN
ncbi:MAG: LamG domain-containing protein [archaeon]